jgi:hypothetical protein
MSIPRKPTVEALGIDLERQSWRRSSEGEGAIEVAFVEALGERWVLLRVAGDPQRRVLVYDEREWDAFVAGAKDGEFDDTIG